MPAVVSVLSRAWLSLCLAELGRHAESAEQGRTAVETAEAAGDGYGEVVARWATGAATLAAGQVEDARRVLERARELGLDAVALARKRRARGQEAHAYCLLGTIARRRTPAEAGEAEAAWRRALKLSVALGMTPLIVDCEQQLREATG